MRIKPSGWTFAVALAIAACNEDNEEPVTRDAGHDTGTSSDAQTCALTSCGTSCIDTSSDAKNCGSCGHACESGLVCSQGQCKSSCTGSTTQCGAACVDLKTDTANCGTCGTACPVGSVCSAGSCQVFCDQGLVACDGRCIDPASNNAHCGASDKCSASDNTAGSTCAPGTICSNGTCAVSCQQGLVECDGICVDPSSSRAYCGATAGCGETGGAAGVACPAGQVCSAGACAVSCQQGLVNCDGTCVDPNTSRAFCGATAGCGDGSGVAGSTCGSGQICSNGVCMVDCQPNLVECNGLCVDPRADRNYCGATGECGSDATDGDTCAAGQVCAGGSCALSCQQGLINCNGRCVNPQTDNSYCGATSGCGVGGSGSAGIVCAGGQICSSGSCALTCQQGLLDCNGTCVDPQTDRSYCGATLGCGTGGGSAGSVCATGEVCAAGTCQLSCQAGFVDCNGECVDPRVSNAHCGAHGDCLAANAGTACGAGQVCTDGACTLTCQPGLIDCNGKCIDPSADRTYCGATEGCGAVALTSIGTTCASGQVCSSGTCALSCQAGFLNCDGACINPLSNRELCGAHGDCAGANRGTACLNGQICSNGACVSNCPSGQFNCGGVCVDPNTNRTFCGATLGCGVGGGSMGTMCTSGQVCSNGSCQLSCQAGLVDCNGVCIDPNTSYQYCGATQGCGVGGIGSAGSACTSGQACSNGSCALSCQAGLVNCGGTCIDPTTSRQYCGATDGCGTSGGTAGTNCASGEVCSSGVCSLSCPANRVKCGNNCIDPQTSSAYCGATLGCGAGMGSAGAVCPQGQVCSGGACQLACSGSEVVCGASCVNPQTNRQFCGATTGCGNSGVGSAGTSCGAGEICTAGSCTLSCQSGLTACSGTCTNTSFDPNNCGSCGSPCSVGYACSLGHCVRARRFSGVTGTTWQTLVSHVNGAGGFTDYSPAGISSFYIYDVAFGRYDENTAVFTTLAAPPSNYGFPMLAWVNGKLYDAANTTIAQYDIATNTWSTLQTGLPGTSGGQTTHDDSGNLWTFLDDGRLIRYNIAANSVTYIMTTMAAGFFFGGEPRVQWDSVTQRLFVAPDFTSGTVYSYDPVANTSVTIAAHPAGFVNDVFCSDRSGHLYSGGAGPNTMYQYDTLTNSWASLPNMPISTGNSGTCTVTDTGWLYVDNGSGGMARLQLF